MSDATRSVFLKWSATRSRVELALASTPAKWGSRRWSLRLSSESSTLELPLGLTTAPGFGPTEQTRRAVLLATGRILREMGASPVLAGGAALEETEEGGGGLSLAPACSCAGPACSCAAGAESRPAGGAA